MNNKLKVSLMLASVLLTVKGYSITINSIEIKNSKELPKEYILNNLPVKVGEEYKNKDLNDIYLSLLKTDLITNVNIYPTKTEKGVDLVVEVDEVDNAMKKLQDRIAAFEASKRTDLLVNSVKIEGNKNIPTSEIEKLVEVKLGEYFVPITVNNTVQTLLNTGYFKEIIPVVNRDAKTKTVDITFKITENPIIKTVQIDGVTAFNKNDLIKYSKLEPGNILNSYSLNPDMSPIMKLYHQKGFLTSKMESAMITDDGNVHIVISEGKAASVKYKKKVEIEENGRLSESKAKLKTKPYIFDRMTYIKEGDFVTENAITSTIKEYYRTGLFSSVEPKIEKNAEDASKRDVTFVVTERPTTSINAQVAYESKEGLTGGLTLADKNFLGRQQDVSISANFGTKGNYDISTSFFDPWLKGTKRLQLGASLFFKREKTKRNDLLESYKNFEISKGTKVDLPYQLANTVRAEGSYVYGGSLTVGKGINSDVFVTIKPRIYGIKTTNAEGIKSKKDKGTPQVFVDYTLGSATLGLTYDTRDDAAIPKSGSLINLTTELGYIFREKSLTQKAISDFRTEKLLKAYNDMKKHKVKTGNNGAEETLENLEKRVEQAKDAYNSATKEQKSEKKKVYEELSASYKKSVDEYFNNQNNIPSLKEISKDNNNKLKRRAYYILNLDARAYQKVYKDKNSMAYRLTFGYASKGTPENMLFNTSDGTTLRAFENKKSNTLLTVTAENRTYINDYVQLVAFGEFGMYNSETDSYYKGKYNGIKKYAGFFNKDNIKADIGLGARLTTPLGVIRLDYAWALFGHDRMPSPTREKGKKVKGKFSFGFGQTF